MRGAIPADLDPILERLGIDGASFAEQVRSTADLVGSAIGSAASCAKEAMRRGATRVVSAMRVERSRSD